MTSGSWLASFETDRTIGRQHARIEDRIRETKATGLRNLPCHRSDANAAWLEILLAATDLVAWTKLIGEYPPAAA